MLARHATVLRDRHDTDALPVHERPAPVANLAGFVRDIDDGLFDAQVRALGGELEFADDLKAGRLVFAAGELRRAVAGDFAGVRAAPKQVVSRQYPFRPDIKPSCARATFALAVRLAQVERIHAIHFVRQHPSAGWREHHTGGFVYQLDAVFVAERLDDFRALGGGRRALG